MSACWDISHSPCLELLSIISLLSAGLTFHTLQTDFHLCYAIPLPHSLQLKVLSFRQHHKYLKLEPNPSNSKISHFCEEVGQGKQGYSHWWSFLCPLSLLLVCIMSNQTLSESNTNRPSNQHFESNSPEWFVLSWQCPTCIIWGGRGEKRKEKKNLQSFTKRV